METNETTTETTAETEYIHTTGTRLRAPSIQASPVVVIPTPTMTFSVAVIPSATAISTAAVTVKYVAPESYINGNKLNYIYCKQCNLAMFPCPCFERYHSLVDYREQYIYT